ncbi:hypothetical protein [Psychrobacter sp. I-STPA6b]|uniref:hypothetical protein n=1 Tax=Psychrobacter sp. I-STPA6b TaxID=2585718 RepID=UPI001D0C7897|nr:hypothetical protein [Psychrobacter sp. I-STPA6b]
MQEQNQDMFEMHYYITSQGITVTLEDPLYTYDLEKAKEIVSLLDGEDCSGIIKLDNK